ncbi:MAG TPA: amidohydrolase family protein [Rhodothermales bacterium]|nr:amidohydrolase family protein [Rhodothermales bacterium]
MKKYLRYLVFLLLGPVLLCAQDTKWDVTKPFGKTFENQFTTDEGTWMSLDVSPDGRDIVFDLLGDLYTMPISGGTATLLAGGPAWELQPRYSPDGQWISFTSDRDGGDNIWMMRRDGSTPKQITKETFRLLNNATWSPDGQYVVARKHFTATRSLGAGEMWLYHVSGGTSGLPLTARKNDQQDAGEPVFSPDGRYVYWSEDMSGGSSFEYNKDPNGSIYYIRRLDRTSGQILNLVTSAGGAVRPQPSPDGKLLAFIKRVRLKTVLYMMDLQTGEEWPVYDALSKDQQETWATFGVYPGFAWMPDGKSVVIWAMGKIRRIDLATKNATVIPFEVKAQHTMTQALRFPVEVSPETFEVKMVRHAVTTPDGKTLVFGAVGQLWRKNLPDGKPERLTDSAHGAYYPDVSPDGKWVVYSGWNDIEHGALYKIPISGGVAQKLTPTKGYYLSPRFSPDGKKVVFQRSTGNPHLGFTFALAPGLYWVDANGGDLQFITEEGTEPRWMKDGKRVFYMVGGGLSKSYKSIDLDGSDVRMHFSMKYPNEVIPSPDGQWVAWRELYNLYVAPFPQTGRTVELNKDMKEVPVTRITRDAGTYLHWSADSKALLWTIGGTYFRRELREAFSFVTDAPEKLPPPDSTGIRIGLILKSDKPSGKFAFIGARVITMKGDEVIENGTILVEGNRIVAVGKALFTRGYRTIDVKGATIMPGIVDVHAHLGTSYNGLSPQQSWSYLANLAFGVTTAHDPSADTEMVFSQAEMVQAGIMTGPRIYSTGTILYGADGDFKAVVNSLEDARSHLRRMKAVGAISVKSYNQPRRNQRQQVLTAAAELGMMVVPEGGSFFQHNLTMVADGHTGVEHALPVAPLYKDVQQFWSKTEVQYTPTLIVGYGGIWGENYWYQKTNVWENKRLLNFVPRPIVDGRSRRRMMAPDDDFGHFGLAQSARMLTENGVRVNLGAHGQLQGLGAHWELWMMAQGGMTSLQAIRTATLNGARYIGMDRDLGSIEAGKLADLVVMDQNPLENIRNTETIRYVMKNGRLYDAQTMNEIGNGDTKRRPFWWENNKIAETFLWKGATFGFGEAACGCFGAH